MTETCPKPAFGSYTCTIPADSARSSEIALARVLLWKKWTAMSVATTAASTMPSRNRAGSRKRSDLNTGNAYSATAGAGLAL